MVNLFNRYLHYPTLTFTRLRYRVDIQLQRHYALIVKEVESVLSRDLDTIPQQLRDLIILVEDRRFEKHFGVDFYSICRSIYRIIVYRKMEGASTLTQQLVRSITNERQVSFSRKLAEINLSLLLHKRFSHEDIFTAYFHYYQICTEGKGILMYCNKRNFKMDSLSEAQCFEIATRIRYPHISSDSIKYKRRYKIVQELHTKKYI